MTRVQILAEVVYISHSTITLGKGMHPTILPQAMRKKTLEFRPVKLLRSSSCVPSCSCGGIGEYIFIPFLSLNCKK